MSWEPPNPNQPPPYIPPMPAASPPDADLTVRRPVVFDNQAVPPPAKTPKRWIPAVVVVAALVAGGAVAYLVTGGDDETSTQGSAPVTDDEPTDPTTGDTTDGTSVDTTVDTTIGPTTTEAVTTTAAPTTTVAPSTVTREHVVFHDGIALGEVTPAGFVKYEGDVASQVPLGGMEVTSVSGFQVAQFPVEVRALADDEKFPGCSLAVGPRPGNNDDPVGLWVDAPTWRFVPPVVTPVQFTDGAAYATVVAALAARGAPAGPFSPGQAVTADVTGDGSADLVVAVAYWDTTQYYQVIAVAPNGDPAATIPVFVNAGSPSTDGAGNPITGTNVLMAIDAIADLTGDGVGELVVRTFGDSLKGARIFSLDASELAAWSCPA